MAQELVYTSAPRGLKAGSRGFCTVEATTGMPPALVAALEGLSGYRHVAQPGDPANPVVFSHVSLSLGGRSYSVVSRIGDAGNDYSGRTNKIAHHLVLDPSERPQGGPAWLVGQSGMLHSTFDGEPRTLPPRRIPAGDRQPTVCKAWQAAAGDAGWAGVLAEAFLNDPQRLAYLVVPPDLDVRRLFEEAIALLPPDRRWGVTFTTLHTSLPQSVTCVWRAVLAGSKEAHESRRFVQALRIDLTTPLAAPEQTPAVTAARTGQLIAPSKMKVPTLSSSKEALAAAPVNAGVEAISSDTPLDRMPMTPRPERLIEPLMAPPELPRRRPLRTVMLSVAAVLCLVVLVSPVVLAVYFLASSSETSDAVVIESTETSEATVAASPAESSSEGVPATAPSIKPKPTAEGTITSSENAQPPRMETGRNEVDKSEAKRESGEENPSSEPQITSSEPSSTEPPLLVERTDFRQLVLTRADKDKPWECLLPIRGIQGQLSLWLPTVTSGTSPYTVTSGLTDGLQVREQSGTGEIEVCTIQIYRGSETQHPKITVAAKNERSVQKLLCWSALALAGTQPTETFRIRFEDPKIETQMKGGKLGWSLTQSFGPPPAGLHVNSLSIRFGDQRLTFASDDEGNLFCPELVGLLKDFVPKPISSLEAWIDEYPPRAQYKVDEREIVFQVVLGASWGKIEKEFDGFLRKKHLLSPIEGADGQIAGAPRSLFLTIEGIKKDPSKRVKTVLTALEQKKNALVRDKEAIESGKDAVQRSQEIETLQRSIAHLDEVAVSYESICRFVTDRDRQREMITEATIVAADVTYQVTDEAGKLHVVPFIRFSDEEMPVAETAAKN